MYQDNVESLAYDIAFWMAGFKDEHYPLDELGDLSLQLSSKFRAIAIMLLLAKVDVDRFNHNLIRSARARLSYLERLHEHKVIEDHHQVSGRIDPVLDAIVAREFKLVEKIFQLLPSTWQPPREYEDDFCYAQLIAELVKPSPVKQRVEALLEQYEQYLAGDACPRLDLCRALYEGDQLAFDGSFESLLAQRELAIEADKARGQLEEPEVLALRAIYIEGLAMLRLAEARGLTIQHEYLFCPSIARQLSRTPFPGE